MATVLIVDDQPDIRKILARLVRLAGHEPVPLGGGREAIAFLHDQVPDLVLLDVMMPDVDGFAVLRETRQGARTAAVPVVMFSAVSAGEFVERAYREGANDYWVKGTLSIEHVHAGLLRHLGGGAADDVTAGGGGGGGAGSSPQRLQTLAS